MEKRVLVFKTSVIGQDEVENLRPVLNELVSLSDQWNFDLEDCDHILRVESPCILADQVSTTLQLKGHFCQELSE